MSSIRVFSLKRRRALQGMDLTDSLFRRGYSDNNIKAVLGGNFRRLLGDSWKPQPRVEKQS
jgi:membrane dipeptidase